MTTAHEHDDVELTNGPAVGTLSLMRQIAITERAMVRTFNATERRMLVAAGCGVSDSRARRLIRAVQHLWKLRAAAFGTPTKARVRLMPMAEAIYAKAMEAGNFTAAVAAVKLQAELCGLRGPDVSTAPSVVGDAVPRATLAPETQQIADRVMERLLTRPRAARAQA